MKLGLGFAAIVALGLSLGACNSDSARSTGGPPTFSSEDPPGGAAVFLRDNPSGLLPNRVRIDVVARGAGELHGAALRVTWDPAALKFVSAEAGESWSKTALSIAKEAAPGQLAVAWTEKGELGVDASGELVLGTLVFESRGRIGTPVAFKTERSTVVDKKGVPISVTWRGGSVASH